MTINIKIKTADDVEHIISQSTINKCNIIKVIFEDCDFDENDEALPLSGITSEVFAWVQLYCDHHKNEENPTEEFLKETKYDEIEGVDNEFINGFELYQLFDLIMAANYLDCPGLLNLSCKKVAFMIKGKTPQEIRDTFGIENDLTPEELEQIKKGNEWCDEKPV
jgi:S-phase kinase-associated protein 1